MASHLKAVAHKIGAFPHLGQCPFPHAAASCTGDTPAALLPVLPAGHGISSRPGSLIHGGGLAGVSAGYVRSHLDNPPTRPGPHSDRLTHSATADVDDAVLVQSNRRSR